MYRYSSARSVLVFVISMLMISACNRTENTLPKTEPAQQQPPTPVLKEEKNSEPSQSERDAYLQTARQEIDQLQQQIDALTAKAKNASADAKVQLERKIEGFQAELQVVEKKWQDLKSVSATAWQDMKNSLHESMDSLRKAVQKETA